jgi:uncharacterized membrane protein YphA (DoxX/SURF4 family)
MRAWWKRHWFSEVPPQIFAVYRMAVGLCGCMTILGMFDVPMLLSIDGIAPIPGGGLGIRAAIQQAGLGTASGWTVWVVSLVGYVLLLLGLYTPLAAILTFLASAFILSWNPLPFSAAQHLLHMLTLYVVFSEGGAVWSVDAWRRGQPTIPQRRAVWPMRLLQYQICLMYLSAGLWKLCDPFWRDGSALHYILNHNVFQRVPGDVAPFMTPVLVIGTYLTLAWELLFTPAMLTRVTRNAMVLIGAGLHIGMWALLDVGAFTPTVLAAYVAFLDPEWVARLSEQRFRKSSRTPAGTDTLETSLNAS